MALIKIIKMNYMKSFKKIVSLIILLTFIFTNTVYPSQSGSIEKAQQAIINLQDTINNARATGVTLDLTKLEAEGAFVELENIKDLFNDTYASESLLDFIIEQSRKATADGDEDVTYAIRMIMSWLGSYHPEVKALELKSFLEKVDTHTLPVEKVSIFPKLLSIISNKIANWFVRVTNTSPNKFTRAIIVPNEDPALYAQAVNDSMRMILKHGISCYDEGVSLVVHALEGNFDVIDKVSDTLWDGRLGELQSVWAVYGGESSVVEPFRFDPEQPELIKKTRGKRGWPFKFMSEKWEITLPGGNKVYWDQWQPIAGEVAWISMGLLQAAYIKHNGDLDLIEKDNAFKVAEEIARTTMIIQQARNREGNVGGIPMGPIGVYREGVDDPEKHPREFKWYYNEISTENNLSWLATLRMLLAITGDSKYDTAGKDVERYLEWAFDTGTNTFCQGGHFQNSTWGKADTFASDVQLWAILVLGVDWIDERYGAGAAYDMLRYTVEESGIKKDGYLIGFDYSDNRNKRSSEWSIFGDVALRAAATTYKTSNPGYRSQLMKWAVELRNGMQDLKKETSNEIAWRYSDAPNTPIEHGWVTPPEGTEHTAATGWDYLQYLGEEGDQTFNPMVLGGAIGEIDPSNFNDPPYFSPEFHYQEIQEKEYLKFYIEAYDKDNDYIDITATNLPAGSYFRNKGFLTKSELGYAKARFAWRPKYGQAGDYNLTFKATDSLGYSTRMQVYIIVKKAPNAGTIRISTSRPHNGSPNTYYPFSGVEAKINETGDTAITENGRCDFKDVPVGTYTISVKVDGYIPRENNIQVTVEKGKSKTVVFRFKRYVEVGGYVEGYVKEEGTGKIIKGATLYASSADVIGTTDSNGYYRIKFPEGSYSIRVSKGGYHTKFIGTPAITKDKTYDLGDVYLKKCSFVGDVDRDRGDRDYKDKAVLQSINTANLNINLYQRITRWFKRNTGSINHGFMVDHLLVLRGK
ncbi:MAG: carboxypeptidase regulatory-like domain-containing protein [Candidatus Omnitrophota bacterium]